MPTGKENKPSKAEAVYFPSRSKIQSQIKDYENIILQDSTIPLTDIAKKSKTPLKN